MEEKLKILVVDDDEVDRMAVRRSLKTAGVQMELVEASDCQGAIATLHSDHFDCVFLDYRLPDGDGLSLVQDIRSSGLKIPLVVLTGQGDEQTAVELMKAGASDYISKGKVSPESLSRSLHNAIRVYRAERQASEANQLLKESEERYRFVLEGSNDGIWDWDITTNTVYWNDRCFEISGLAREKFVGNYQALCHLLHPEDRSRIVQAVRDHLEHQVECNVEFKLLHASGHFRYCIARGKAQRDGNGKPFRMSGIISDITERKRALENQRFLAEASAVLSASLDYKTTLENLAQLAVPHLADLCLVDILGADGSIHRLAAAHGNPTQQKLVQEMLQRFPPDPDGEHPASVVLRTGKPKLADEVNDEMLVATTRSPEHLQIVREIGFQSYMVVPLLVRGRTLGAISFVSTQEKHRYDAMDLSLAEELARRAALSVENGKLYREAQAATENLRKAIIILGEQQQQLRTLQQLTNLLNQRLSDLPGLLRVMVQAVCDAIAGAQFCFIMLQNPQCNRLVLTVTAGIGTEKLRLEDGFSSGEGLLSQVFLTGISQLIEGEEAAFLHSTSDTLNPSELPASLYVVAIESAQAGRLGVLAIGNWENSHAFDEEDRYLLAAVGEQAAIAINNARLINALEEREERLALQNEILAQQNKELENLSTQIQLQNLQLMEAARLKSQFLATMSHELRTPMNAVIGFSQLLLRQRQNQLTPQQLDMVDRILSNGKHLLTLINDILDLSKIEAGRLELQPEEFNLPVLVRTTAEELRSLASEKHLELQVEANLQNPQILNDSARMRQILVNLLSNAIKFTDTGSVYIKVQEVSPDQVLLTVQDTGIGIAEENLKHIFEEFRQVDQSLAKRYPGTGLGLAITHSLVQLMHGKISVESHLGQGSTFQVEFPRRVSI
ncbi:ATP-binding protein [Coleofasciculus sp. FACHB-1120]|uniref:ATP-binding protein n=1 Tax=Coleofasciculus sp. FACHB-1120 TaxID=2692783 RepID=UPI001681DE6C|nr:ATP-binding protein [Coleofasciculus sp. FACHB-1120]MBD2740194.1 response regulator [Coleofasciculus sp. FACHB-1120]